MAKISIGTLYDVNKQLMANDSFKPLAQKELLEAQKQL